MSGGGSDEELDLAWALLSPDRAGVSLEETAPDPPIDQLGALAGFGAIAGGYDVRISVYVFDAWGGGHEHTDALRARAEASGRRVCVAVNGALLLVGTAPLDDDRSGFVLNDVCSAFAGGE